MVTVQLGWLQSIFDWIVDQILSPVFKVLGDILGKVFEWFIKLLKPVLELVLNSFIGDLLEQALELFFFRVYWTYAKLLFLLDCIEEFFNVIAGVSPVYVKSEGGIKQGQTLISAVFMSSAVQKALALMIGAGMALCIFIAIIATVRSVFEWNGRETKPVSHVFRMAARSMLYFILIPFACTFIISLSSAVLKSVDIALSQGMNSSLARTLFCITSLNAIDVKKHPSLAAYNASYEGPVAKDFGLTDPYRKPYFEKKRNAYGESEELLPKYMKIFEFKRYFTYRGMDYIIGFGVGGFLLIMLFIQLFVFCGRLIESIVLILVGPFFVATMPLDEGAYCRKWADLLIGKLFSGFGLVAVVKLYLMLAGILFSNQISFVNPTSSWQLLQNYVIKLVFLMGGALAVKGSGPLITGLLSSQAAQSEQMYAAAGEAAGGSFRSGIVNIAKMGLQRTLEGLGGLGGRAQGAAAPNGPHGPLEPESGQSGAFGSANRGQPQISRSYRGGTPAPGAYPGIAPGRSRLGLTGGMRRMPYGTGGFEQRKPYGSGGFEQKRPPLDGFRKNGEPQSSPLFSDKAGEMQYTMSVLGGLSPADSEREKERKKKKDALGANIDLEKFPMPGDASTTNIDLEKFPMPGDTSTTNDGMKEILLSGSSSSGSGKSGGQIKDIILGDKSDGFPFDTGKNSSDNPFMGKAADMVKNPLNPLEEPFPMPGGAGTERQSGSDMKDILLGGGGDPLSHEEPFPMPGGAGTEQQRGSDMKDALLGGGGDPLSLDEPFPMPSGAGSEQQRGSDMKDMLLGGGGDPLSLDEPFPMPSGAVPEQQRGSEMKDILLGGGGDPLSFDEPFPMPSGAGSDMKDVLLGGEQEPFPMESGLGEGSRSVISVDDAALGGEEEPFPMDPLKELGKNENDEK